MEVVTQEVHTHPEKYPAVHNKDPVTPLEIEQEVEEFEAHYELPKDPKPSISPVL